MVSGEDLFSGVRKCTVNLSGDICGALLNITTI